MNGQNERDESRGERVYEEKKDKDFRKIWSFFDIFVGDSSSEPIDDNRAKPGLNNERREARAIATMRECIVSSSRRSLIKGNVAAPSSALF